MAGCASHHLHHGTIGNDIRSGASFFNNAVDANVWLHVLAQSVHTSKREHRGIGGVYTFMRRLTRMSRFAGEGISHARRCNIGAAYLDLVAPVPHQGYVSYIENALVDHDDLSAPAFFERAAHHVNVAGSVSHYLAHRDTGGGRNRSDQVVTASMTEPGQGIVLGKRCYPYALLGTPRIAGTKSAVQTSHSTFNCHPVPFQVVDQETSRARRVPAKLRIHMDVLCYVHRFLAKIIDHVECLSFEGFQRSRAVHFRASLAGEDDWLERAR